MADSEVVVTVAETEQSTTEPAEVSTAAVITEDLSPPTDRAASPLVPNESTAPESEPLLGADQDQATPAEETTSPKGEGRMESEMVSDPEKATETEVVPETAPEQDNDAATVPDANAGAEKATEAETRPEAPDAPTVQATKKKKQKGDSSKPKKSGRSTAEGDQSADKTGAPPPDPATSTEQTQGGADGVRETEDTFYTGDPLTTEPVASSAPDASSAPAKRRDYLRHYAQTDDTEKKVRPRRAPPPEWSTNPSVNHDVRKHKCTSRSTRSHRDTAPMPSTDGSKGTTPRRRSTRARESHGNPSRGHKSHRYEEHTSDHKPRNSTKAGPSEDDSRDKRRSKRRDRSKREMSDGRHYADSDLQPRSSTKTGSSGNHSGDKDRSKHRHRSTREMPDGRRYAGIESQSCCSTM